MERSLTIAQPICGPLNRRCFKCKKNVLARNSVARFDALIDEYPDTPATVMRQGCAWVRENQDEHLLPTADCEGSPSRRKYFEGMRGTDRLYYPEREEVYRRAFRQLQEGPVLPFPKNLDPPHFK